MLDWAATELVHSGRDDWQLAGWRAEYLEGPWWMHAGDQLWWLLVRKDSGKIHIETEAFALA